jgi:dTDP-glucose pyrophosphorylase
MKFNWQGALIGPAQKVVDALSVIDRELTRAAFVVDDRQRLIGLVTDGDIRRGLLAGIGLDDEVKSVMNASPLTCSDTDSDIAVRRLMEAKDFLHMPILDDQGRLVNVLSMQEQLDQKRYENPVFLMAGGFGSRLHPLTANCPKPLLRIGQKPIMETILDSFIDAGFYRFYISTHYLSDMVKEYFGDGSRWGVEIQYTHEESPLGTGGALGLLPSDLPAEPMIMMNGDILTKVNFERLLDYHQESEADATICVRQHEYQVPYGVIQANDLEVQSIDEKPVSRYYVNAGIYVLNPEVFRQVKAGQVIDMPNLLNSQIEQQLKIMMYPLDEYWLDVGRMSEFEQAQQDIAGLFP